MFPRCRQCVILVSALHCRKGHTFLAHGRHLCGRWIRFCSARRHFPPVAAGEVGWAPGSEHTHLHVNAVRFHFVRVDLELGVNVPTLLTGAILRVASRASATGQTSGRGAQLEASSAGCRRTGCAPRPGRLQHHGGVRSSFTSEHIDSPGARTAGPRMRLQMPSAFGWLDMRTPQG